MIREAHTLPMYSLGTMKSPRPNPDRLSVSGEIEYLPAPAAVAAIELKKPREVDTTPVVARTTGPFPGARDELTWVDYRELPLPHWVWVGAVLAFASGFATMLALG